MSRRAWRDGPLTALWIVLTQPQPQPQEWRPVILPPGVALVYGTL